MTLAHPIPAAIDGLIALWSDHPDLEYTADSGETIQMRVLDGPPITEPDDKRLLIVGVGSQFLTGVNAMFSGVLASEGNTGFGSGGRRSDRLEVTCQMQVWSGDTDMTTQRALAFEVLEVLGEILAADRTLSGVADWARIVRVGYQPEQSDFGAGVAIDFTVLVETTRFEGE